MEVTKPRKELLFVYGTLLEPEIQREAFGRSTRGEPDLLFGYERKEIFLHGETYPIIMRQAGARVPGRVLSLTTEELKRLDKYEDPIYQRIAVTLNSGRQAWVYAHGGRAS
jgi:gamma-glutamylcyclotransferase (GGCT)/AIG2-like uncharacterized protein YtfP